MSVLLKVCSRIFSEEFYSHPKFDVHLMKHSLLYKIGQVYLKDNQMFWKFIFKFLLKEKNEKDYSFKTRAVYVIEKLLFYHFCIT